MLATERHAELRRLAEAQGTIIVSEVARNWNVSEMTIRRDLRELEQEGVVARVHGGAVAGDHLRWRARLDRYGHEKAKAVAKVIDRLPQRGCIYLDGSTTIYTLIERIDSKTVLKVVTNNVDTFQRLNICRHIEPILIGGNHNRETDNFIGPLARLCLNHLSFDAAFFSCYGVQADLGTVEPSLDDAEIKQIVCERSRAIHIAVNHEKLGRPASAVWTAPTDKTTFSTDLAPADDRLDPFRTFFATIL